MFIRVYNAPYVQIQFNRSKLRNFISSWKMVKNTIKFYRLFLNKTNKTRVEMFCTSAGMTSLTLNPRLRNFITPGNLIKTPQNFIQGSFSIKLTKNGIKAEVEVWAQVPIKEKLRFIFSSLRKYYFITRF